MLFIVTFGCFALVMAMMALGIAFGRQPLSGGCGRDCRCAVIETDSE